ncbi:MAG: methyltransferase domain-containing protein [Candidatus Gracilibacteria bacterium]|nr:methyltransferase domain-containing protein [Candidatus Gracilibacteria bacterium]
MKKIIEFLLKIKATKVMIAIVSSIIQGVSPSLWKKIETHFYNPYDFDERNIEYSKGIFTRVADFCKKYDFPIDEKDFLELGPGGFLGTGAFLKKAGAASYSVVDSVNHFEKLDAKTIGYYQTIDPSFLNRDTFNDTFVHILKYNEQGIQCTNESIDVVFSNAVYEHVSNPAESIQDLARITRKGGIGIHQIDYRDHIFDQKSLFFLTVPKFLFDLLFKNCGGWTNLKRHSFFREAFIKNGFEILEEIPQSEYSREHIAKYREKLSLSLEDLSTSSGCFVVRKK